MANFVSEDTVTVYNGSMTGMHGWRVLVVEPCSRTCEMRGRYCERLLLVVRGPDGVTQTLACARPESLRDVPAERAVGLKPGAYHH